MRPGGKSLELLACGLNSRAAAASSLILAKFPDRAFSAAAFLHDCLRSLFFSSFFVRGKCLELLGFFCSMGDGVYCRSLPRDIYVGCQRRDEGVWRMVSQFQEVSENDPAVFICDTYSAKIGLMDPLLSVSYGFADSKVNCVNRAGEFI